MHCELCSIGIGRARNLPTAGARLGLWSWFLAPVVRSERQWATRWPVPIGSTPFGLRVGIVPAASRPSRLAPLPCVAAQPRALADFAALSCLFASPPPRTMASVATRIALLRPADASLSCRSQAASSTLPCPAPIGRAGSWLFWRGALCALHAPGTRHSPVGSGMFCLARSASASCIFCRFDQTELPCYAQGVQFWL